jgi:nucleotide-binding universal stress UspA family protein
VAEVQGGIVCGVDDSPAAVEVVAAASLLAEQLAKPLLLVHVIEALLPVAAGTGPFAVYPRPTDTETERRAGELLLERLAHDGDVPSASELRVVFGDAATLLCEIADEERAELMVVGTRRHSRVSSVLRGSVSSAALTHAPCPLLVVPPGSTLQAGPLVCAVDDSPEASSAFGVATRLARRLERGLVLVQVIADAPPPPATSRVPGGHQQLAAAEQARSEELLAELVAQHGFAAGTAQRIEFGHEAETIRRVADEEDAALIAVGTRRLGALRAAFAGSDSRRLMETSERPLLLVPSS